LLEKRRLSVGAPRKAKENPARLVQHKTENNGRIRFLSREEEAALRPAIRARFPDHEPELDLALHAGLRKSEQYNAKWTDVDFDQGILTIPLDKSGRTSHVKLNKPALRAVLDLHRLHGKSPFVCGGVTGPRYWFEAAIKEAKIKDFTWHCLRHTFASRLVMSGTDLRTVAELLRDTTLAMVMRYAHLAPDFKSAALERMAASFPDPTTSTKLAPALERQDAESGMVQ
jgi:integrase